VKAGTETEVRPWVNHPWGRRRARRGVAIRRRTGRPRGSVDRSGRARRVDAAALRAVMVAFAAQLRRVREAENVSAAELAAAMGINPGTVHRLENGQQYPTLERLASIALALGVPLEHLIPEAER
jgi:ribosome-binding protein aMBF1 (putative translation factor)